MTEVTQILSQDRPPRRSQHGCLLEFAVAFLEDVAPSPLSLSAGVT